MFNPESKIVGVRVACDLQQQIEWDLEITLPLTHSTPKAKISLLDWCGEIVFRLAPFRTNSWDNNRSHPDRRRLAARLISNLNSEPSGIEIHRTTVTVSTAIDGPATEALDQFRCGKALHARVEGTFVSLMWPGLEKQLEGGGPGLRSKILSASHEITRDVWCEEFLPKLLPPGKLVMEIDLSAEVDLPAKLRKARTAYYAGRYDEMVGDMYKLIEKLPTSAKGDPEHVAALRTVLKGLRRLCNLYRHTNPETPPLGQPLARFILLTAMQTDVLDVLKKASED